MSAEGLTFVDTNVLVYAYDVDAGTKHHRGRSELVRLWDTQSGAVSTQVLQEFYITVTRKLAKPLAKRLARDVVTTYRAWPVHRPTVDDIAAASELEEKHRLSFWDALIIVSAQRCGARTILSEDLQGGRRFGETSIANPFTSTSPGPSAG